MNPRARERLRQEAARTRTPPPTVSRPGLLLRAKDADVCASKRRHSDEVSARAAGSLHLEENGKGQTELYAYRCQCCFGWHLTRFPQGAPITAADPVKDRRPDAMQEVMDLIMTGPLTSYFDCPHGDTDKQQGIHQACMELERQGKILRHRQHARQIIWKAK